jgi:hypothetical protein
MADYIQALKRGLEAAEVADRARKEIDSVFDDLDRQLRGETEGKIGIKREEFEVERQSTLTYWSTTGSPEKERYWAIVAYNPKIPNSPVKKLAIWSQERTGYPSKIAWAKLKVTCEDKKGLEDALEKLISDPLIGEVLQALMQLNEKTPE